MSPRRRRENLLARQAAPPQLPRQGDSIASALPLGDDLGDGGRRAVPALLGFLEEPVGRLGRLDFSGPRMKR